MTGREAGARALSSGNVEVPVHVVARGDVPGDERAYALRKVVDVASRATAPLMNVHVRVEVASDPARERPATVECALDCSGHVVRAHAAGGTVREATDLAVDRLQRALDRIGNRIRSVRLRHRDDGVGEWHHGDAATRRPPFFDRPLEEREIVRRKAIALEPQTVDEAVMTIELLDHDFLLFSDARTDANEVLHRLPGGRYELIQSMRRPVALEGCVAPVVLGSLVATRQRLDDAVERLDVGGEPFVFFTDEDTGRANIVYRRYDGHYGLITAAA